MKERTPGRTKPETFALHHNIEVDDMKMLIHYRRVNGMAEADVIEIAKGIDSSFVFVIPEKMEAWLAATQKKPNLKLVKG